MPESGIRIRNVIDTGLREKMLNRPGGGLFKNPHSLLQNNFVSLQGNDGMVSTQKKYD
jgi:hypothetical protein